MQEGRDASVRPTDTDRADLVHRIYDTALDNSLWPDMILRVFDVIEKTETDPAIAEDLLDMSFAPGIVGAAQYRAIRLSSAA